jgi:hypothetical protein
LLEGFIRFLRHVLHSNGAGWHIAAAAVAWTFLVVLLIVLSWILVGRAWRAGRKELQDRRSMR